MKPTTSTGGRPDTVCRADSTKKDIQSAQLRRRRFDDQVLEDILEAMRLAERVLEDTLDGRENITSGCRKYGLDGNQMQYLIYGMRTILEDGKRPVSREELDHALEGCGQPDCVEQLYRQTFYHTGLGAKKAVELMPADASETVEYICRHPSWFSLSDEEGEALQAVHLDGYGPAEAAGRLS